MKKWQVYAASATGAAHLARDIPCQDAFHWAAVDERLVAAVCDGAGSASQSATGADFVSRQLVERLSWQPSGALTPELIQQMLEQIRMDLYFLATEANNQLEDYACTLVAAWIDEQQVCLIHLGDGVAAVRAASGDEQLSVPENGEYANQTWFLTSENWREHLRITFVSLPVDQLILMSDGVQPFALDKSGQALFDPFMGPVIRYLQQTAEEPGSSALQATLGDPRTSEITGDDKTLLIALRS
jgi:hypothetical protein